MNFFNKLPGSAKGLVMVMAMCAPVVTLAGAANPGLLRWFLSIYIVLGVVGTLGAVMLAKKEKKKSESFTKEVNSDAGRTEGIRDPDKIREVDDMRQQFERGLEIYRQYGKDIYSLPWYVVVGESGSGKTEALRRSELGFPDKLQDYWQGTGGTLSMHWWFTNQGVILDTAGRLFISDGPSNQGPLSQWTSFLKMLRKNRPECPINGVILVIPATSLIPRVDPEEEAASYHEIDSKAGQIARQMEVLQSELGVRFPVYILISKTDRVLGFREFFESIETPEERHQMLGWSNPAGIDQGFDPTSVTRHLKDTADRLRGRRMALLKDPVAAGGSGRLDEVDAMFALPESFESLAPKLERYLRSLFVLDEWSAPPHFLRGIYFTSALQQGTVLDEALAQALGKSMAEMERGAGQEDLSLARNRSYFLRDFFLEKVFQEAGLVMRSGRKARSGRGWKFWVPASFAASLLALGAIGWITGRKPSEEVKAWTFLANEAYSTANYGFHPIAVDQGEGRPWAYLSRPVKAEQLAATLARLGSEDLGKAPRFGWLFAPATWLDGGVKADRKDAYRVATERIVLAPLIEAGLSALESDSERWAGEGITRAQMEVIEVLLGIFDDGAERKPEDLDEDLERLTRIAGLSRDRAHRHCIGALKTSVRRAYPDARIPRSLIGEAEKRRIVGILSRLVDAGGGDLGGLLQKFDEKWRELTDLDSRADPAAARALVVELGRISASLKLAEPRIRSMLLGGVDEEASAPGFGRLAGPDAARALIRDRRPALERVCGANRIEDWDRTLDDGGGEARERLLELVTRHAELMPEDPEGRRYHELRSSLCDRILKLGEGGGADWSMRTADRLIGEIDGVEKQAEEIGMADEARTLLSIWAFHFTTTRIREEIGFPLVFPVRADGAATVRELDFDGAAGMTLVAARLARLSDRASERLDGVLKVAGAIFNLDSLAEEPGKRGGRPALVKDWKVELGGDRGFELDVSELRITVSGEGAPPGGNSWVPAEDDRVRLLRVDLGAKVQFSLTAGNPGEWRDFAEGGGNDWAAVRWYLRQLGGAARGVSETFNRRAFGLRVIPPADAAFPADLTRLPTPSDLDG